MGNRKQTHYPSSNNTHPKGKSGESHTPPVGKALFSLATMKPGSKNHPFEYAANLVGYRLGKIILKDRQNKFVFEIHSAENQRFFCLSDSLKL